MIDKDLMEDMDFDNLLVVDHLDMIVVVDIQKMDLNFDKDLMLVDMDLVDNHYLLEVEAVDFQFVEEHKVNNCSDLVVDYLMHKDL
jgi:hypothetical protein